MEKKFTPTFSKKKQKIQTKSERQFCEQKTWKKIFSHWSFFHFQEVLSVENFHTKISKSRPDFLPILIFFNYFVLILIWGDKISNFWSIFTLREKIRNSLKLFWIEKRCQELSLIFGLVKIQSSLRWERERYSRELKLEDSRFSYWDYFFSIWI